MWAKLNALMSLAQESPIAVYFVMNSFLTVTLLFIQA